MEKTAFFLYFFKKYLIIKVRELNIFSNNIYSFTEDYVNNLLKLHFVLDVRCIP